MTASSSVRVAVQVECAPTVLDALARWTSQTPDALAVRAYDPNGDARASCTYLDLARSVSATAQTLERVLAPDEAAILQAPNGVQYATWFLAGLLAGVRIAAVHPLATPLEVSRVAHAARARAIISARALDALPHLPLNGPTSASSATLVDRRGAGGIILQSSGTGGEPRLVRRTEASLDADARGLAAAARLCPDDRVLIAVPLSHSYGVDLLVATIAAGASLHILERFDLPAVLRLLDRAVPTFLPGVPFMFEALARAKAPARSLRLALSAGSMLPPRIADDCLRACSLTVGQLYGATELGTVALDVPGTPGFDPRSVGLPVAGASVRIVAPGNPEKSLLTDAEGEVVVKAPSMLAEYIDAPFSSIDGHFLTGDLGRIDSSGRLFITGRLKHLIDVGGMKVNPLEVEEIFSEHPAIADFALVALPLSDTVTRLRLLCVPRPGASIQTEELRAFARERLSPHKLPRVFESVDSLPRSSTGKLLRSKLNPP